MKILSWLWRWQRCGFRCLAGFLALQGSKCVSEAKGKYVMLQLAVCCDHLVTQISSGACLVTIRLTLGNERKAPLCCFSISVVLVCWLLWFSIDHRSFGGWQGVQGWHSSPPPPFPSWLLGGKQALLLQQHHTTVVKAPEITVNRSKGKRKKSKCCHRPGLEGWALHAECVRHPGTLVSTFSLLQKELCPTSEPAIAPGSWLGDDWILCLPMWFSLLCHSLWSESYGNSSWSPMLRSSCASEQEEKWWHEGCGAAITL